MSKRSRRYTQRLAARDPGLLVPSPELWLPREWPERSPFARGLADSPYIGNPTCCCENVVCNTCFEDPSYEFDVTIAGLANGTCIHCSGMNGTFRLTSTQGGTCIWSFIYSGSERNCDFFPGAYSRLQFAFSVSGENLKLNFTLFNLNALGGCAITFTEKEISFPPDCENIDETFTGAVEAVQCPPGVCDVSGMTARVVTAT